MLKSITLKLYNKTQTSKIARGLIQKNPPQKFGQLIFTREHLHLFITDCNKKNLEAQYIKEPCMEQAEMEMVQQRHTLQVGVLAS